MENPFKERLYKFGNFIFCLVIGYIFLLPFLILSVVINEVTRAFISFFLLPKGYTLVKGERESLTELLVFRGGIAYLGIIATENGKENQPFNIKEEREWFESKVFAGEEFQKLKLTFKRKSGYLCYNEGGFDIGNHVKLHPRFNEVLNKKQVLEEIVPQLCAPPCWKDRPQWEWIILPKVDLGEGKGTETFRLLRMHWSYGDAYSWYSLFTRLLSFDGKDCLNDPLVYNAWNPHSFQKKYTDFKNVVKAYLEIPYKIVGDVFLGEINEFGKSDIFVPPEEKPLTEYSYTWSTPMRISVLKRAAKGKGLSVNSVISTAFRNALCQIAKEEKVDVEDVTIFFLMSALMPGKRERRAHNNSFTFTIDAPLNEETDIVVGNTEVVRYLWWQLWEKYMDRFPLRILDFFLEKYYSDNVPISMYVGNVPFTKVTGTLRKDKVRMIGYWEPEGTPVGTTHILITYGEMFQIFSSINKTVFGAAKIDQFYSCFEQEINKMGN